MEPDTDRIQLLRSCSLFSEMSDETLARIAGLVQSTSVRAREELFHRGDDGSQLYILVRGRMKVVASSADSGEDLVLNLIGPGEVVGELAILTGSQRTATIEAVDVCELLVLDRRSLFAALSEDASASLSLARVLAERLEHLSDNLADLKFTKLPQRLAKRLLDLAEVHGEEREDGVRIKLRLSQGEWGNVVGATRESINKQLGSWKKAGIVETERGFLVVKKPDELRRIAGQSPG
ncbi:MAG: Crp/Fnr family transcriptional regulator [Myxococcota bacterium]